MAEPKQQYHQREVQIEQKDSEGVAQPLTVSLDKTFPKALLKHNLRENVSKNT